MAKDIYVVIPRRFIKELPHDKDLGRNLYNAVLEAEVSHEGAVVEVGKGKAKVFSGSPE